MLTASTRKGSHTRTPPPTAARTDKPRLPTHSSQHPLTVILQGPDIILRNQNREAAGTSHGHVEQRGLMHHALRPPSPIPTRDLPPCAVALRAARLWLSCVLVRVRGCKARGCGAVHVEAWCRPGMRLWKQAPLTAASAPCQCEMDVRDLCDVSCVDKNAAAALMQVPPADTRCSAYSRGAGSFFGSVRQAKGDPGQQQR